MTTNSELLMRTSSQPSTCGSTMRCADDDTGRKLGEPLHDADDDGLDDLFQRASARGVTCRSGGAGYSTIQDVDAALVVDQLGLVEPESQLCGRTLGAV